MQHDVCELRVRGTSARHSSMISGQIQMLVSTRWRDRRHEPSRPAQASNATSGDVPATGRPDLAMITTLRYLFISAATAEGEGIFECYCLPRLPPLGAEGGRIPSDRCRRCALAILTAIAPGLLPASRCVSQQVHGAARHLRMPMPALFTNKSQISNPSGSVATA